MRYQLHRIHLEQYFMQQKNDLNRLDLCWRYSVSTLVDIFCDSKIIQHSMLYISE